MDSISIILPTYNEKGNIVALIEEIAKVLKTQPIKFEIVVVDDNSPDGTAQLVRSFANTHAFVTLVVRKKNRGLGNSIREGVLRAKGDVIIGMDADFNHKPETLPLLIKGIQKSDLTVASRFLPGGGMNEQGRFLPTHCFNVFFQVLGFPTTDSTSGYYAVRKATLETLGIDRIYYGYGDYHLRLVWFVKQAGLHILEVPTFYGKRLDGVSKSRLLHMAVSYVKEAVRLSVQKEK